MVLGATIPGALAAAGVDLAMARGGATHVLGLCLVAALPLGVAQALLAAAAPEEPSLRERGARLGRWFGGEEGAARIFAAATATLLLLVGIHLVTAWFFANHQHPALIALAVSGAVVVQILLCAVLFLPLVTLWKAALRALGDPTPAAAVLVISALVGGWAARLAIAGPPAEPPDLRPLLVLMGFVTIQIVAAVFLARRSRVVSFLVVLLGVLAVTVLIPRTALTLEAERRTLFAVQDRSAVASRVLRLLRSVTDGDKDGYSPLFGGGDCDDSAKDAHPGSVDLPGDGLDLDCNGKD